MKIGENKHVTLGYELRVAGTIEDKSADGAPLRFIFGQGTLLPKFEENIEGLVAGDRFAFTLTPEEGYGERREEAIVEVPKNIFMLDGRIREELLVVGTHIPMSTADGGRMTGVVASVGAATVTMDFNSPMAGKTLDFTGEILAVRDAMPEEMKLDYSCGGGCINEGCSGEECAGCSCGCSN